MLKINKAGADLSDEELFLLASKTAKRDGLTLEWDKSENVIIIKDGKEGEAKIKFNTLREL